LDAGGLFQDGKQEQDPKHVARRSTKNKPFHSRRAEVAVKVAMQVLSPSAGAYPRVTGALWMTNETCRRTALGSLLVQCKSMAASESWMNACPIRQ
jgi:hypothetical protein